MPMTMVNNSLTIIKVCEFVCTSKMDVQNIVRKGLDLVRKENS